MKIEIIKSKLCIILMFALFVIFSSGLSFALDNQDESSPKTRRMFFGMKGGYSHSEGIGGMADLNLEVQFSLTSNVRVGLGVGYLGGSDHMHMAGPFGISQSGGMGGMMGGSNFGMMGGFTGHGHNLRVVPITLTLYYFLPVSPMIDMFMEGGAGYYISSYRDQSTQNESSFGPHLGLGVDFKLTDRIAIVAEGLYRFVKLKGFMSELHEGFQTGMDDEHEEGFWHYHHHEAEWHFHEEIENMGQMFTDVPPFDISLNGFSLRAGIKFSF